MTIREIRCKTCGSLKSVYGWECYTCNTPLDIEVLTLKEEIKLLRECCGITDLAIIDRRINELNK